MKTKYRALASVYGAVVLAVVLVPAASPCGGSPKLSDLATIQPLLNPKNPLEGASAETVFRDVQAAASGRTASIVGMWKITELSIGNTTHNPPIPNGAQ